jgi:hypothetical protein
MVLEGVKNTTSDGDVNTACHFGDGVSLQPGFKRFVTFYFTNFPEHIYHFHLKKALEVCGILENVYVPMKRNVSGHRYRFARFSNVRDVTKLLHAINDISFDQFRIRAKVARFDKSSETGVEKGMGEQGRKEVGGLVREKKFGRVRMEARVREEKM